jgi:hypothetical protein
MKPPLGGIFRRITVSTIRAQAPDSILLENQSPFLLQGRPCVRNHQQISLHAYLCFIRGETESLGNLAYKWSQLYQPWMMHEQNGAFAGLIIGRRNENTWRVTCLKQTNKQTNSVAWVRERTIPTERSALVGEVRRSEEHASLPLCPQLILKRLVWNRTRSR